MKETWEINCLRCNNYVGFSNLIFTFMFTLHTHTRRLLSAVSPYKGFKIPIRLHRWFWNVPNSSSQASLSPPSPLHLFLCCNPKCCFYWSTSGGKAQGFVCVCVLGNDSFGPNVSGLLKESWLESLPLPLSTILVGVLLSLLPPFLPSLHLFGT